MKKLLVGLAAVPFLAGVAMAGQPMALNDAQMDKVTAGGGIEFETNPFGIELNVHVLSGFPFSLEAGGVDPTHTFCLGNCPATATDTTTKFELGHITPIGPWTTGVSPP